MSIEIKQPPLVTWLLPVRNSMPYLRETLASMAAQTYPHHRVLAFDASSTDGSLELLNQWIPGKIAGEVVSEDRPRAANPLGESLRKMVQRAGTELCARIDGDDICPPNRLELQVERMLKKPSLVLLSGNAEFIDLNGKQLGISWLAPVDDASIRWQSKWMVCFTHSAVIFRRAAVIAAGNYRNDISAEDAELWLRLSFQRGEMENLRETMVLYRRHGSSLTAHVRDFRGYLPLFREAASRNAAALFPGVAAERAMELWDAAHPYGCRRPVVLWHLRAIRSVATRFAENLGLPRNYFMETDLFKGQYWQMRRNLLHRLGLKPALDLYWRLRRGKAAIEA